MSSPAKKSSPATQSVASAATTAANQQAGRAAATKVHVSHKTQGSKLPKKIGLIVFAICLVIGFKSWYSERKVEAEKNPLIQTADDVVSKSTATESPTWYRVPQTLIISDTAWTSVQVKGDRCILWHWSGDPDHRSFKLQARGVDDTWHDWSEWKSLRKEGKITFNFAWIRVMSNQGNTEFKYEFRNPDECS